MNVYVDGRKVALDPARAIGKGGEADVFALGDGRALKLFKAPEHPDYAGLPGEQAAAAERLQRHQRKLREFPADLPELVIKPEALATDRSGRRVLGYTMRLLDAAQPMLRYGERGFREGRVSAEEVLALLRALHGTLRALHGRGVVVGDFNDLNILVHQGRPYVIDADSFQFGPYPCLTYTERFLDPLLSDGAVLALARPYNADADWYAFAVLVMQSLLYVGPYGGVHRAAPPAQRALRRISVFHPEVRYPKPALPLASLGPELHAHLRAVFERDARGVFPEALLQGAPQVKPQAPALWISADVKVQVLLRCAGRLLAAGYEGRLRSLVHEDGAFRREGGQALLRAPLRPGLRALLAGDLTLLCEGPQAQLLRPGAAPQPLLVDAPGGASAVAAVVTPSGPRCFWAAGGFLWRDGEHGQERWGEVLAGQTRLFCGARFGLGFYQAGELRGAFVFATGHRGLRDGLVLPLGGEIIDATCAFGDDRAFLFITARAGGRQVTRCLVLRADGALEAEATSADEPWLLCSAGACTAGGALLCPSDEGVLRVEVAQGGLRVARRFASTEPFVDAACVLLPLPQGLGVVDAARGEIRALSMT